MNTKKKSPCLNCADRQTGCHGRCETYQEWRRKIIESKQNKPNNLQAYEYSLDKQAKSMRRKKRNGQSGKVR